MSDPLKPDYRDGQALAGQHLAIVGASSGVGLALAGLAAAAGARLTLFGRDMPKLRSTFPGPASAHADFRHLDLHDPSSIERALTDIPVVDHLAVTAGTFTVTPFADTHVEQWRGILEERIIGPLTLIQALAPKLRRSIVLFSGGIARRPLAGCAVLAAAVAGVEGLARALSLELAPVRVNVVAPGALDTPMIDKILGPHKDQAFSQMAASVPARRVGTADDAAHAALFLMTNVYMTAATIEIDGGAKLI
jgi:NAD(P)-dependent dehydrogenase (short-subunit alcohol dehydrogenase family)